MADLQLNASGHNEDSSKSDGRYIVCSLVGVFALSIFAVVVVIV